MKNREKEYKIAKEDNTRFVIADNGNPLMQRARELMVRAVARERIAMWAQIQALEEDGVETETPASELWREMPELAREHEASREDDGLSAEDVLVADDWEFGGFGVTA
jgi:hypothetical protein